MSEILQLASGLGGGIFLAVIIFLMYRQDRKASEKRLTHLLEQDQETRKENTEVLTELVTLITRLNGRLK